MLNICLFFVSQESCRAGSTIRVNLWRNSGSGMLQNLFSVKQLVMTKRRCKLRYYPLLNFSSYEIELKLFREVCLLWKRLFCRIEKRLEVCGYFCHILSFILGASLPRNSCSKTLLTFPSSVFPLTPDGFVSSHCLQLLEYFISLFIQLTSV